MDKKLTAYHTTETLGKSSLELVIQVYDGAIASFHAAHKFYLEQEYQSGYDQLERARRFVTHLYTTLDNEKGGEVAENLSKLYVFVLSQIDLAESTKDLEVIKSNLTVMQNLRDGWVGIKDKKSPTQANTTTQQEIQLAGEFTVSG